MMEIDNQSSSVPLSRLLREALRCDAAEGLLVADLIRRVGEKGFGILLLIFALPSAAPAPAPGYSVPFGLVLFVFGWQMLCGRVGPVLPQRALRRRIPPTVAIGMLSIAGRFFAVVERVVRPRWHWIQRGWGRRLPALIVLAMAILMMIPIPGTNTIPAAVVFLIGAAMTERDGLLLALAGVGGIIAIAIYTAAIVFLIVFFQDYGWEAVDRFLSILLEWLRGIRGQFV